MILWLKQKNENEQWIATVSSRSLKPPFVWLFPAVNRTKMPGIILEKAFYLMEAPPAYRRVITVIHQLIRFWCSVSPSFPVDTHQPTFFQLLLVCETRKRLTLLLTWTNSALINRPWGDISCNLITQKLQSSCFLAIRFNNNDSVYFQKTKVQTGTLGTYTFLLLYINYTTVKPLNIGHIRRI